MRVFGGWVFDREWMRYAFVSKNLSARRVREGHITHQYFTLAGIISRDHKITCAYIRKQGKKVKSRRRQEMTGAGKYFAPQSQFEATI